MTIDIALFAELLDELAGYYGRKITPFIKKAWYKKLGTQMSSEQFVAAVEQALTSREFMPTAEALLELAKGSSEVLALEEWEKCLAAAARGQSYVISELSPSGQFALRSIGGFRKLELSDPEKDHQWLMKKFFAAWKEGETASSAPALPAAKEESLPLLDFGQQLKNLAENKSLNGNGKGRS